MRVQRDKRLQAERTTTIKSRYQEIEKIVTTYQRTHHPHDFFISTPTICESPGVSESLVGSDEDFQKCLSRLPDLIPVTHVLALEKRRGEILKLLPEGSTEDDLGLAVSWFKCRYCGQTFHHAGAVKHSCYSFRGWTYKTHEEVKSMKPLELVYHICGRGMWSEERLTYCKDAAELTRRVVKAVCMDPKKATPEELDGAKHRFVVFTGAGSSSMTIVGWRCLVSHAFATLSPVAPRVA